MIGTLVVFAAISVGGMIGWFLGSPGGTMGSYFAGVCGASLGLYLGRKLQKRLPED